MDDWLIKCNKWCGLWCINFINELARKFMYCKGMWKIDEWFSFFAYSQRKVISHIKNLGKGGREENEINVSFFLIN